MRAEAVYRKLQISSDPAMPAVQRIYESAFPQSERKPSHCFEQMVCRADYAIVLAEIGEAVVGFAVVFIPSSASDAALLEYLAVEPERRGGGVGKGLLQQALQQAGNRPMLVEVESAEDCSAARRREFYRRNGFTAIPGLRYVVPLPNAPAMELMMANATHPPAQSDLARWIKIIFESVYGLPATDRRVRRMLNEW